MARLNGHAKKTGEVTLTYLCGHPEMIVHGKSILRRKGFPAAAIREATYWRIE